ncbi:MAG TPA: fluoride efflux transporter CrcB [Candidatus Omnitrophota bacterium]|nr:fluoride efflux transporter CrcB [Candidatus Omnitrophota bacterium]
MMKFLIIGFGGALGAIARYLMGSLDYWLSNGVFPISTLVVNVTGSLAIGFLWGICDRVAIPPNVRLFLFIGVLGGYTTFSTFSLETFNLMRDGEYRIALINAMLSVVLSVGAVFAGYIISKILMDLYR